MTTQNNKLLFKIKTTWIRFEKLNLNSKYKL